MISIKDFANITTAIVFWVGWSMFIVGLVIDSDKVVLRGTGLMVTAIGLTIVVI